MTHTDRSDVIVRQGFDMDAALDRALRVYHGRDWPHRWPVASEENERERMRRTIQAALDEEHRA